MYSLPLARFDHLLDHGRRIVRCGISGARETQGRRRANHIGWGLACPFRRCRCNARQFPGRSRASAGDNPCRCRESAGPGVRVDAAAWAHRRRGHHLRRDRHLRRDQCPNRCRPRSCRSRNRLSLAQGWPLLPEPLPRVPARRKKSRTRRRLPAPGAEATTRKCAVRFTFVCAIAVFLASLS